ncbi:MAG: GDP-L-fucose synthase family protein [Pseudomonadales bacterium]
MENILLLGAQGMVGSAISRRLNSRGVRPLEVTRANCDLTDQRQVRATYTQAGKIDRAIVAAAKVGGIHANDAYPAEFIYENLLIQTHIIHEAYTAEVAQLIFLGSSCIYPRLAQQPMIESELLTGPLEPTNEAYAISKIAGIKMCESYNRQYGTDYRSLMPTNLYGPNDNFSGANSHVIPALMTKFAKAVATNAPSVEIWGSGNARREFLHVDDLASAVEFCMDQPKTQYWSNLQPQLSHINVGTGQDISISELADLLKEISGFSGKLVFDQSKPDGAPRKLLDTTKLNSMGWQPTVGLQDGLAATYKWLLEAQHVRS